MNLPLSGYNLSFSHNRLSNAQVACGFNETTEEEKGGKVAAVWSSVSVFFNWETWNTS